MHKSTLDRVVAAIRATAQHPIPETIEADHSLVFDLGFDSMGISLLSIGLEDEFGCPVLLDGWIGSHDGPSGLTVGTLCSFMESLLDEGTVAVPH